MRKHCPNVCKLRLCLATESTNSAPMRTIVTAALQRQYSQTELNFLDTLRTLWLKNKCCYACFLGAVIFSAFIPKKYNFNAMLYLIS